MTYLSDEVEGDHISGLSGDGVGSKLELVVRSNRDHHSRSRGTHGLSQANSEHSRETHLG